MLKDEIKFIIDKYNQILPRLNYNYELFDIYEGNLLQYVLSDIKKQVSYESFKSMEPRVVPINFLKKIIDKLSQIYNEEPERGLLIPSDGDVKLFEIYKKVMSINVEMALANEIFNLEKYAAIEPYIDEGIPSLRVVQPDKFFVLSTSKVNPTKVTHYVKIMGKIENREILHVYTDTEFLIIDSDGNILNKEMDDLGNPNGINFYGKIPCVYISRSKFDLIPREDTDLFKMTKILPILFSDLNDVVFWQSFSIIYGIDLGAENLKMAPNSFWSFKSDPTLQTKPEVGSIKPQADIAAVMGFIMFQLNTWLNTRGIKSFGVGDGSANLNASGLSKMVDELDTSEDRKKQIPFFKKAESELWNLIMNYMHPYWVRNNLINTNEVFTDGQQVIVEFETPFGIIDPIKKLDEVEREIKLGLTTKRRALMKINPSMTQEEAEEILEEIEKESTIEISEVSNVDENNNKDSEKI